MTISFWGRTGTHDSDPVRIQWPRVPLGGAQHVVDETLLGGRLRAGLVAEPGRAPGGCSEGKQARKTHQQKTPLQQKNTITKKYLSEKIRLIYRIFLGGFSLVGPTNPTNIGP